jgi:uncharacterized membrane protein YczE
MGDANEPHDDARYAEVLLFPSLKELRRRLPPLVAGIVLIGVGIALSVRAELGLSPWDVLHQGIANQTNLAIGTVVIIVGLVVLLAWIPLRQHLGIGTIINTLTIGLVADAALSVLPHLHLIVVRIAVFVVALLCMGFGGGLYIGAGLGPGPRDGLMTAITARGYALWKVRTAIECSALVAGFALGGTVGVGTIILAFSLGPMTHFALRRFHLPVHEDTQESLGE